MSFKFAMGLSRPSKPPCGTHSGVKACVNVYRARDFRTAAVRPGSGLKGRAVRGAPACPTAHTQAQPPQRTKSEIKRTVVRTVQRSERCSHVNNARGGGPIHRERTTCARLGT